MQKTITVEREIKYEGRCCDHECNGLDWIGYTKPICDMFGRIDLEYLTDHNLVMRCRACLEKTGDV